MSKQAEQQYLEKTGEAGRRHSQEKPFSDEYCGVNLAAVGSIVSMLPSPPGKLLDLGCGAGWTSTFFSKYGYDVVGHDISPDMIALGNENKVRQQIANLRFVCGDFEALGDDESLREAFDVVVFFDSLHHADDALIAIQAAYSSLKPGGMLVTHEPGAGHSTTPGSLEAMRLYGVNERDMPPHLIIEYGIQAGFKSFRIFPMQDDLLKIFYGPPPPKLWSKKGFLTIRRLIRMVFNPSLNASSIVVQIKPQTNPRKPAQQLA